jgi:hypothetical protein
MPDRPWAPSFRGFSPFVAAGSSRIPLSSMPFPTLRCRGSEDFSKSALHAPCGALLTANGCVHRRKRFHARRRVAPLLAVSPLRG